MRYLGIDYGKKRIGLALSDEEGKIAFPHRTIEQKNSQTSITEIRSVIGKQHVSFVVVGLPLDLDGKETSLSAAARKFAERLGSAGDVRLLFENEIFTTRMAKQTTAKKESIDAIAAAIILQSYLDKKIQGPQGKN